MKQVFFREFKEIEINRGLKKITSDEKDCVLAWKRFNVIYNIKDYAPEAVWDIDYIRPDPPKDPRDIINYGLPKEERKFPYYTEDFKKLMEDRIDEKHDKHAEYKEFIYKEWDRRKNGLFFYNGDKLEYITGRYYMFLQYWLIPVIKNNRSVRGNPEFRDNLLVVSYASEITRKDNKSVGVLFYSGRRSGKTSFAVADGYFDATEHRESVFSIQSKTEEDAKKVFKKLVDSWQKLPAYFKPLHTGETVVKRTLDFSQRKKIVKEGDNAEYKDAINSVIYYVPANEAAQDGTRVTYQFTDEVGKCKSPIDVNERHNINRECLVQGNDVLGKAFVTSTIEDFDKYAAKESETLWNRSNPNERKPSGMTDSGLYRLFIPAYFSLQGSNADGDRFVDEWGYTDIDKAKKYIIDMYNSLEGSDLLSFRRKYPLSINDSFALAGGGNSYSKERLLGQKQYNEDTGNKSWVKGNFVWLKGKDSEVVWRPDKDGRWSLSWMPKAEDRCKFEYRGTQRFPTRSFAMTGADPFAHSHVQGEGSRAAAATIINGYAKDRGMDHGIACIYLHRTEYTEESYEDILMQMIFFSSPSLPENNVYALIDYIRQRGYEGFVNKNPLEKDARKRISPKRGISFSGTENREAMMSMTQTFIYDHIGYDQKKDKYGWCPDEVIDDWLGFEPTKWTKYDMSVAMGSAIIGMYADPVRVVSDQTFEMADWYHIPK